MKMVIVVMLLAFCVALGVGCTAMPTAPAATVTQQTLPTRAGAQGKHTLYPDPNGRHTLVREYNIVWGE